MTQTPIDFMRAYEQASNSHSVEALLAMVDEAAVFLFSDESVHGGRQAIEAAVRRNFESIEDERYAIDNVTWVAESRDVAACVYDYAWSGTIGGRPASGSGRGTTVLRRTRDGWKVVHEHLSKGRFSAQHPGGARDR